MNDYCTGSILIGFLVLLVNPRVLQAEDAPLSEVRVQLRVEDHLFPLASPVPLVFDFCNDAASEIRVEFDHSGLPRGMKVTLTSPSGEETEARIKERLWQPVSSEDPLGKPRPSRMLPMPSGSCVRLAYELNRWFALDQIGQYSLRLAYNEAELANFQLEIVNLDVIEDERVTGIVEALPALGPVIADVQAAHCRVQTGSVGTGEDKQGFIIVRGTHIGPYPVNQRQFFLRMPVGTRIAAKAIDARWRLWMLLQSGEENALLIGNLIDGSADTVIEWTREEIVFRTTWAQNPYRGKIVVAGKPQEPLRTTLTEAAPFRGRSANLLK